MTKAMRERLARNRESQRMAFVEHARVLRNDRFENVPAPAPSRKANGNRHDVMKRDVRVRAEPTNLGPKTVNPVGQMRFWYADGPIK